VYPEKSMSTLRSWIGLTGVPVALASACVGATSSQFPPDAGTSSADAGTAGGDGASSGACDTATTWQVALGAAGGGGTLTFVVPSSDVNGGTWSPASGITYSFDAATCTVTLTTGGCPGGTFDLATRACHVLTAATCDGSPCEGCPSQSTTCTLSGL
jgi:hypothetical protein